MVIAPPTVTPEEVAKIRNDLAARGCVVPEPQAVTVTTDDLDGELVFIMTVIFPKREKPENLPWKRINPLVRDLRKLVFAKSGEEYPVAAKIRRLGERFPRA